jgi:hypothetical protein
VVKPLLGAIAIVLGCDAAPAPAAAPPPAADAKPAAKAPALAPAPEGATILGKLYVQTCAASGSCPTVLQVEGAAHCSALATGGLAWRLPTQAELKSWRGKPGLVGFEGFHWSSTPFADAPDQVWIFDPTSGSETTIPKDRKPFMVRCVAQPGG